VHHETFHFGLLSVAAVVTFGGSGGVKDDGIATTIADDRPVPSVQDKPPAFVFLDELADRFAHFGRRALFGALHRHLLVVLGLVMGKTGKWDLKVQVIKWWKKLRILSRRAGISLVSNRVLLSALSHCSGTSERIKAMDKWGRSGFYIILENTF
jgi:hypothetical protein